MRIGSHYLIAFEWFYLKDWMISSDNQEVGFRGSGGGGGGGFCGLLMGEACEGQMKTFQL